MDSEMDPNRAAFLARLAEDEDDATARLIYADWLDEHGEHDEADRQRKWPAAKAWLVAFCAANNPDPDFESVIDYETLIEKGREAVAEPYDTDDEPWLSFSCGSNMTMSNALGAHAAEFWRNWSIVTGVVIAGADPEERSSFHCAC